MNTTNTNTLCPFLQPIAPISPTESYYRPEPHDRGAQPTPMSSYNQQPLPTTSTLVSSSNRLLPNRNTAKPHKWSVRRNRPAEHRIHERRIASVRRHSILACPLVYRIHRRSCHPARAKPVLKRRRRGVYPEEVVVAGRQTHPTVTPAPSEDGAPVPYRKCTPPRPYGRRGHPAWQRRIPAFVGWDLVRRDVYRRRRRR